jgi:hypothetical protein
MNFNHWAANGVLLGGAILGSEKMTAEGRHGLETFPLRTWCWFDGSTQESIDHYYFSISLKDQKVFADLGSTAFDRIMGRNILAKSFGELASAYHPSLRRFVSSSGRTGIAYLLAIQDGTKHIVHTLSRQGALSDMGRKDIPGGMPMLAHDADPGTIAQQTLNGPWADDWVSHVVDDKPLPFEMTASYKQWGAFSATPLWNRSYLGRDVEVVLSDEGELTEMQGGGKLRTSLVLNLYNYHRLDSPLDRNRADLDQAWGGFALEMADTSEFTDFAAFQKHVAATRVDTKWDAGAKVVRAVYSSGSDTLEAGFAPCYVEVRGARRHYRRAQRQSRAASRRGLRARESACRGTCPPPRRVHGRYGCDSAPAWHGETEGPFEWPGCSSRHRRSVAPRLRASRAAKRSRVATGQDRQLMR